MIILVTGGSGSGKSAYAEEVVLQAGGAERFYIATMEVFGEEGKKKVERHRRLRRGKGFSTIECPRGLDTVVLDKKREDCVVLLECMANLAANEMFSENLAVSNIQTKIKTSAERMKAGIRNLEAQCRLLVVVSSEVFSDGLDYGEETNAYIWLMGEMNCWLAQRADTVVEVVYGIPVVLKNVHGKL